MGTGGDGGQMTKFSLKRFLESHPPLASATNLDSVFADPARAGTLLELPENLPKAIIADIQRGLASLDFNRYPVADAPALQAQIAAWLNLPGDHTALLGNGALDLIDLVLQSLGAGATVQTLDPDFAMYRLSAGKYGITLNRHPLDAGFSIDTAALVAQIHTTAPDLLILSNPHNPTSTVFPLQDVETLVRESSGLVLIDEAYAPFAPDPNAGVSLLGRYPNLLILRSFSKVGAAAIRFGFLMGHKQVLDRISAWQTTFAVSGLSILAAQSIIRHDQDVKALVRQVAENREAMIRRLRELPGVEVYPSCANFIIVRLKDRDAQAVFRHLVANGIKAVPFNSVPILENCLRFGVDTRAVNDRVVEQLSIAVSGDRPERR